VAWPPEPRYTSASEAWLAAKPGLTTLVAKDRRGACRGTDEEADELADRVGIINGGRLVAEGTPAQLKRSMGNDVIVARVDSGTEGAKQAVACLAQVSSIDVHGDELMTRPTTVQPPSATWPSLSILCQRCAT
jgi:hypothetical protein